MRLSDECHFRHSPRAYAMTNIRSEVIMGIFHVWHSGILYAGLWPDQPILDNVFKEGRVIRILGKSAVILPPVLALTLVWSYCSGFILSESFRYIPWIGTVITAANCVFIPLSGYWWLGKRAEQTLTGKYLSWYQSICAKLDITAELAPNGLSLAGVLKKASRNRELFKRITDEM